MIHELVYEQVLQNQRRLLYTEKAGAVLSTLQLPTHRLQIAQGMWPLLGPKVQSEYLLEMVQLIGRMATSKEDVELFAKKREAEVTARLILRLLSYAEGNKLQLGAAFVRIHLEESRS